MFNLQGSALVCPSACFALRNCTSSLARKMVRCRIVGLSRLGANERLSNQLESTHPSAFPLQLAIVEGRVQSQPILTFSSTVHCYNDSCFATLPVHDADTVLYRLPLLLLVPAIWLVEYPRINTLIDRNHGGPKEAKPGHWVDMKCLYLETAFLGF